jgi:hypothetical protein
MAHRPIAEDVFLMSETGPVLIQWLEPGQDRIWVVDRNGAFVLAGVRDVKTASKVDARRLLTPAGDVLLPDGSLVMTAEGPTTGAEIEFDLKRGRPVRVDIVSPTDLPPPKKRRIAEKEALCSCFAALPNRMIQLPRSNGAADSVSSDLQRLLKRAGVRFRCVEDDRWTAFILEATTVRAAGCRAEFGIQADALALATAWAVHDDGVESRVRLGDHGLRRRLLVALAGAGRGFEVKWVPGYRPVESRVRPLTGREWPARVPVISVLREMARVVGVDIAGHGDPIVSLAVLSPARL